MCALVADVARYPEFLPLCESLKVLSRTPAAGGTEIIVARMTVGYGPLHESFTSRVVVDKALNQIDVTYLDGPFRQLHNRWLFKPAPQGCDIDFDIAYEFRSLTLQVLLGAMFDRAFRKFADAFEARARKIYGLSTGADSVKSEDISPVSSSPVLRPVR